LPEQPETWVEVDPDTLVEINAASAFTRCAWTPFEGMPVTARVRRVVLRGKEAFHDGQILANPGDGQNVRML
jgi:carbamoyl-phosphate synthase/aspartate carbamoyltransferase/dihydroorotase